MNVKFLLRQACDNDVSQTSSQGKNEWILTTKSVALVTKGLSSLSVPQHHQDAGPKFEPDRPSDCLESPEYFQVQ